MSSALSPSTASQRLAGVQYVRGLAALMVVFDHASSMAAEPKYFGRHPLAAALEGGGVGVDVFFVISGFIIAYIALDADLKPRMSALDFYRRRLARIVPVMWVAIALYAALRAFAREGYFPGWAYLRSAVLLWPFGNVEPTVIWTLRYEAWFYVVFGLAFLAGARWLMAAWIAAPFAAAALGLRGEAVSFFASPINLLFGVGLAIGAVYIRTRSAWRPRWWAPVLLVVMMALIYGLSDVWRYDRRQLGEVLAIGAASGAVLILACLAPQPRGPVGAAAVLLGNASYAIYLMHSLAISAWLGLAARRLPAIGDLTLIAVAVVASVAIGLLLHPLEAPLDEWGKRLLGLGSSRARPALRPA